MNEAFESTKSCDTISLIIKLFCKYQSQCLLIFFSDDKHIYRANAFGILPVRNRDTEECSSHALPGIRILAKFCQTCIYFAKLVTSNRSFGFDLTCYS